MMTTTFIASRVLRATLLAAAVVAMPQLAGAQTLATYQFNSAGWATFGLALPQGAAVGAVKVGNLTTQTDVKRTWPDGSIRHAAVTARISTPGALAITPASTASGSFSPTWPEVYVDFTIAGLSYRAAIGSFDGTDPWLHGSQVREARKLVAPVAGSTPHPFLRVVFDVRSYADGTHEIDVAVNNTLNVTATDAVSYDVAITVGGQIRFIRSGVLHHAFKRWRTTVASTGFARAEVLPDYGVFVRSGALPDFRSGFVNRSFPTSGAGFDILQAGQLTIPMTSTGGRFELGPRPDPVALYSKFPTAAHLGEITYYGGNPSAFWTTHITEADGTSLVSLDAKPAFWFDPSRRFVAPDGIRGPANDMRGTAPSDDGDPAHYPSLAFAPYVMTGQRWYADEIRFTANYHLIRANWARSGAQAIFVFDYQKRGTAWAVRDLADAGAWLPDNDPYRIYFEAKLINNLAALDSLANSSVNPLGSIEKLGEVSGGPHDLGMWQVAYMNWAVDHARRQLRMPQGAALIAKWCRYQVALLSPTGGWHPAQGMPYYHFFRRQDGSFFSSMSEMWDYNIANNVPLLQDTLTSIYSGEALLNVSVCKAQGTVIGAIEAHSYVTSYTDARGTVLAAALASPRFVVAESSLGPSGASAPQPPANARILP